jgi:catechol 2,3-dioxygenase-like lactoylglutathione lyase family enzyme
MLDHISIPVADLERAAAFYDGVLQTIGLSRRKEVRDGIGYAAGTSAAPCFWLLKRSAQNLAQPGIGLHIAFQAQTRASVDRFHARAIEAGATDAGPPGPRPEYTQPFYGAFVRDLDGFKIEAVCRTLEST